MKLIAETNFDNVNVNITEAADGKSKNYFIEGIFMQGGIKNRNGRMYPMETMQKEVDRLESVLRCQAAAELQTMEDYRNWRPLSDDEEEMQEELHPLREILAA